MTKSAPAACRAAIWGPTFVLPGVYRWASTICLSMYWRTPFSPSWPKSSSCRKRPTFASGNFSEMYLPMIYPSLS